MRDATNAQSTVSRKKLRANRRNARSSTGPRTPAGKAVASRNATTHGIFCRDAILPGEDSAEFHALRHALLISLSPQDAVELMLCDRIVSAQWRMNRLRADERLAHEEIADRMLASLRAHGARETREAKRAQHARDSKDSKDASDATDWTKAIDALSRLIPAHCVEHQRMHGAVHEEDDATGQPVPHDDLDGRRWDRALKYERNLELTVSRGLRDLRHYRDDVRKHPRLSTRCPFVPASCYEDADDTTPSPADADEPAPADPSNCQNEPTTARADDNPARGTGLQPVRAAEIVSENQDFSTDPHRPHGLKTRATGEASTSAPEHADKRLSDHAPTPRP